MIVVDLFNDLWDCGTKSLLLTKVSDWAVVSSSFAFCSRVLRCNVHLSLGIVEFTPPLYHRVVMVSFYNTSVTKCK